MSAPLLSAACESMLRLRRYSPRYREDKSGNVKQHIPEMQNSESMRLINIINTFRCSSGTLLISHFIFKIIWHINTSTVSSTTLHTNLWSQWPKPSISQLDRNRWRQSLDAVLVIYTRMSCLCFLSLKYLNVSANSLESIPPSSQSEESLSTLQELYLTGNKLNENCGSLLVGHQNLRVLHIAYNQLLSFPARCVTLTSTS